MELLLDGRAIPDRNALHDTLQAGLALPEYYGRNLDALSDLLEERAEETCITLLHSEVLPDKLGRYGERFLLVLRGAAEENPHIRLQIDPEPRPEMAEEESADAEHSRDRVE